MSQRLDELLDAIDDPDLTRDNSMGDCYPSLGAELLSLQERAVYVGRLTERAQHDDGLAVMTLGRLPAPEALPVLLALARRPVSNAALARRAVAMLGSGSEIEELLVADLAATDGPNVAGAAQALTLVGGPRALDALDRALDHPYADVRIAAWEGLVTLLDLDRRMRDPDGHRDKATRQETFEGLLLCDRPFLYRLGATGMREIRRAVAAGGDPVALGLTWTPDPAPELTQAVGRANVDPSLEFPVAGIAELTGVYREWCESAIAMGLDKLDEPDLRVPDALARLSAHWTRPALEEVAQLAPTPAQLRAAVARALATLR